jgi:hypothetical protein
MMTRARNPGASGTCTVSYFENAEIGAWNRTLSSRAYTASFIHHHIKDSLSMSRGVKGAHVRCRTRAMRVRQMRHVVLGLRRQ